MDIRDTRYARTPDGIYIAYQVVGEGPVDIVWQFDYFGNVDVAWEHPLVGAWFRGIADFARLILHDRRGTGLSSRNVPPPNLETRVADLRVVLDAVASEDAVLAGYSEGGAPNVMFAAVEPQRVRSIVWIEPSARIAWAPDYPWGAGPEYYAKDQAALDRWGTSEYAQAFSDEEAVVGGPIRDEEATFAPLRSRHTGTPDVAREISRIWWETDVRGVLPTIQVPALLISFDAAARDVQEAEYIASLMPAATTMVFPGSIRSGQYHEYLDAIRDFVGIERAPVSVDTILSTVLFTDIVGSTQKQASLGDLRWKELLERHHAVVREGLARYRGVENDTAGDGFYATFDGPARAIRCAQEVSRHVRDLGIEIRSGVHTGECELIDGKVGGLAVTIGARVAASAGPSEVRVSQTVKDLVAGSGFTFEDAGEQELKGVPDRWRLYRVVG